MGLYASRSWMMMLECRNAMFARSRESCVNSVLNLLILSLGGVSNEG